MFKTNLISHSPTQTLNIGKKLSKNLKAGDIICLFGDLGSGKTVLTKGIAHGLGVASRKISSPSFVILRCYKGKAQLLNHFDLYRLAHPRDILALGYEEYLYDQGISVIEWAQRLGDFLPRECLKIELNIKGAHERLLKISASGTRYQELLKKIHEDLSA